MGSFAFINTGVDYVDTIISGIIIFAVMLVAGHVVFKALKQVGESGKTPLPAGSILGNIARVVVYVVGAAMICNVCFNYDLTAFIAALGVGGIAVSLGFQDTLSNLFGGLQVSLGKLVHPSDYIEVVGKTGKVADITWRHTLLNDPDGTLHVIPNSVMNKNPIARLGESRYLDVPFQLPPTADIDLFTEKAKRAVVQALPEGAIADRGVEVLFTGEELGLVAGKIRADVRFDMCPPSATVDKIWRAADAACKEVVQES